MCPGGVFVVEGLVAEAAVKDADEPVAERTKRAVVGVAGGTSLVVEGPGAGACGDRGERPLVAGISEPLVAGVAGEHDAVFAGCFGDG